MVAHFSIGRLAHFSISIYSYMIALGKKPKNDEVGDCWLIHEFKGNLSFNAGDGIVILSYDKETDKLTLYPGGEYCRAEEADK